jgi:tricarballylate dehydrogenase
VRTENIPVVVVGGGSAAFEAAVAAKQAGAPQVVMLEKAPEPEFGGNARYSHTGFRWVFSGAEEIRTFLPEVDDAMFEKLHLPAYSAEQFHADLERVTRGRIDNQLAPTFWCSSQMRRSIGCASWASNGRSTATLLSMAATTSNPVW